MGSLANAFALLGLEQDQEASTIVAVKTAEVKKVTEEHKKIVAQQKKIAAQKKKAEQKKIAAQKKKAEAEAKSNNSNNKKTSGHGGNAVDGQRYVYNGSQRNGQPTIVALSKEEWLAREAERKERWLAREAERKERWLAREAERKERWLANQERWLAREAERKEDMALKTLKEYEEQKALEKQNKAEKSTLMSVPETPLKEATPDNFTTKHKSKHGPARGMGAQDSRKNMNNGIRIGYRKHNQNYALPEDNNNTVEVKAEPAAAPDLSETNFPVLGKDTKPTKLSVKHSRKDNTH